MTTESQIVPTVVDEPMDFTVIATSPAEMERGQKSMILWTARKIIAEKKEVAEAEEEYEIAKKNRWTIGPWRRRVAIAQARLEFYKKVKIALEAGYYIVPPFPMQLFAIRTNKTWSSGGWRQLSDKRNHDQRAENLPGGEGEYKSPRPVLHENNIYERTADGSANYGKILGVTYSAGALQPVDFPFKMVKPIVMQETAKAMALKVFDQLGILPVLPNPSQPVRQDPIICGQILAPGSKKPLTFFVAWWLDTRTL